VTGVVDMSGTSGGFQAIAAEVLGVGLGAVQVVMADTGTAPSSPGSGGSAITYGAGRAVRAAAEDARRQLIRAASLQARDRQNPTSRSSKASSGRSGRRRRDPDREARPGERAGRTLADRGPRHDRAHEPGALGRRRGRPCPGGPRSGEVDVLDLRQHLVQDVGRVLKPALVAGQQLGGVAQAVGWALRERLVHDTAGQLLTSTFLDYAIPRADDVGTIETTSVEVPSPDGPFGAKGIAEAPVIPGPAAIANAIAAARASDANR
jgi:CO/xanthine dehydrogenase Mo-binding subunit